MPWWGWLLLAYLAVAIPLLALTLRLLSVPHGTADWAKPSAPREER